MVMVFWHISIFRRKARLRVLDKYNLGSLSPHDVYECGFLYKSQRQMRLVRFKFNDEFFVGSQTKAIVFKVSFFVKYYATT